MLYLQTETNDTEWFINAKTIMKKLFLILTFALIGGQLHSQDLIVTTNGDSLNCKIKCRILGNIHYKFSQDGKIYHSQLPKTEVKTFKYDYYNNNATDKYLNDNGPIDLVLTQDGDSIRCKIVALKFNQLYYKLDTDSSASINHLPEDQVKKYKYDYYHPFANYQKWTLSFNGGYSRRLAKVSKTLPSNYADHIKQLKEGYHLEADFTYYVSEYYGIGAKCALFKASNSQTITETEIYGTYYYSYYHNSYYPEGYYTVDKNVNVEDKHTIPYIGLMGSTRLYGAKKRGTILINCSAGYLGYTDAGTYNGQSFTIKGNTLGLALDFGYDYWFSRNMALGVRMSLISGTLKECTKKTAATEEYAATTEKIKLKKDEYEGLGRLDISVGLRFG